MVKMLWQQQLWQQQRTDAVDSTNRKDLHMERFYELLKLLSANLSDSTEGFKRITLTDAQAAELRAVTDVVGVLIAWRVELRGTPTDPLSAWTLDADERSEKRIAETVKTLKLTPRADETPLNTLVREIQDLRRKEG